VYVNVGAHVRVSIHVSLHLCMNKCKLRKNEEEYLEGVLSITYFLRGINRVGGNRPRVRGGEGQQEGVLICIASEEAAMLSQFVLVKERGAGDKACSTTVLVKKQHRSLYSCSVLALDACCLLYVQ